MEEMNKDQNNEKTIDEAMGDNIIDRFKKGELKLVNTDSVYLTNDQMSLLENGNQNDENVQNLLKEKNMLLGKGFIYRINDEILMSLDSEDMGTCLYERYSNIVEKLKA